MSEDAPAGRRYGALVPVAVFAALAALLYLALFWGDPSEIPTALKDKPVPDFVMPPVDGLQNMPGLASDDLKTGAPTIVNVWASWCGPCRVEHPVLMQLAERDDVRLVGLNYKDAPQNARRFLGTLGNPFQAVGADRTGRTAIDWGVYGVPETFIVDGNGIIRFKYVGPIAPADIENVILPELESARTPVSELSD
ncbi:Cytochrome c-type biogenesis protein CcmG/DsbE,thiol:disulfide oxidoreductase [Candidatus Phaeomarinobacter ectocarpi]|uniref:Cytochrome c-type biogenesis protein CcmG/DsbE,thiol:disulfide oxidoreductase n=1 Tax=Candidatus Phaeomarinibacter ectocarpi TaxID=1458461 RepID=X5MLJ4_9HYPH|nr:DsbE family thiol:disulfide interchange protein [Candidatus Phaeomarinobacter ectocarpi]CDO59535.1 Cytochrome c-type biogenesis protein CcmG/DsbE,thiol:disulfide oxidoreductase [Candidatus Phaeomarinobacter ectocarpi]